ncbi:MAG TPA: ABC transporter permease [Sphingomicrobium sp.]|nr:ABC transporter permease [Sphingomicrobium sp.]
MPELLRAAFVIARRDFTATVLSRAFIFFLIAPLFPILLGGVFGGIGARVAEQASKPVVAVAMAPAEFQRLSEVRNRLARAVSEDRMISFKYVERAPDDWEAQARKLLAEPGTNVRAVVYGWFGDPLIMGDLRADDPIVRQVGLMLDEAQMPPLPSPDLKVTKVEGSTANLSQKRALTGQLGQMLLFFLTLLLAGMLLSQVIEEKSNKIIEVIAAAVRIDAMFLGKLFAMLCSSLLGITVWVTAGAFAIAGLSSGGLTALPVPAVGWPLFLALGFIYFAMNYLLFGAVFLGIGAQASTAREVQTLSMPVTFAQVLIFGVASTAVGSPGSPEALAAAAFPLSSPLVMVARAAEQPEVWPHLLALAWQALWVGLILWASARLFRRSVLKSGPQRKWWKLGRGWASQDRRRRIPD